MRFFNSLKSAALVTAATLTASTAFAVAILSLSEVNVKVAELTKPFNNATTTMNLAFTKLNIDAVRTLDFGIAGTVTKQGPFEKVALGVNNATYAYGDGTKPTMDLELTLDVDLVRAFGQKMINDMAGDLHAIAEEMAKDYALDYGPAATIVTKAQEKTVDAAGNVNSVKIAMSAAIDQTLLPTTKPVSDVEFQTIEAEVSATRTQIKMKVKFVANPLYKRFQTDGEGLKEFVEKVLTGDAATYEELRKGLEMFDSLAKMLSEMKP